MSAGGGYAPNYLPGLGSFLRAGKFFLVACASCGLVRFFASPEAIEKLPTSAAWERI